MRHRQRGQHILAQHGARAAWADGAWVDYMDKVKTGTKEMAL